MRSHAEKHIESRSQDCLAVITARNSHIYSHCASNISLFMHHRASIPFKKCRP